MCVEGEGLSDIQYMYTYTLIFLSLFLLVLFLSARGPIAHALYYSFLSLSPFHSPLPALSDKEKYGRKQRWLVPKQRIKIKLNKRKSEKKNSPQEKIPCKDESLSEMWINPGMWHHHLGSFRFLTHNIRLTIIINRDEKGKITSPSFLDPAETSNT